MTALDNWLRDASTNHPLKSLNANEPTQHAVLSAIDSMLTQLDHALPQNIEDKRSEFAAATTDNSLLSSFTELRLAAQLVRAEVVFRFGKLRSTPEPDIVLLKQDLGIELTSRYLDGVQSLHAELEHALSEAKTDHMVQLSFNIRPLYIPEQTRADIIKQVTARTGDQNISSFQISITPPTAPSEIVVRIDVLPTPPLADHLRVTWTHGPELDDSLATAQSQVIWALHSRRKTMQAKAMPTIGVVNIAHMGLSWLRPDHTWARALAAAIPADSPYVAIGVIIPTLDNTDQRIATAIRPNAESHHAHNVTTIAHALSATLAD